VADVGDDPALKAEVPAGPTPGQRKAIELLGSLAVPVTMTAAYVILILVSDVAGVARWLLLLALGAVLVIWVLFRELRSHAAISRMLAVGEPDEVIRIAEAELGKRLTTKGKVPFWIYLAGGHELRGDWAEARLALDKTPLAAVPARTRDTWGLLHASYDVACRLETGDAAGARKVFDDVIAPAAKRTRGPGIELLVAEGTARLALVEGDPASARDTFQKLARDVRLGPAPRAIAHALAARAADALGDAAAADEHRAQARKLAPKTWMGRASE
jgi:hypothetical protein